jgi:hypothetical protein
MTDAPIFTLKEVYWTVAACAPLLICVGMEIGRALGRREERLRTIPLRFTSCAEYATPTRRAVFLPGPRLTLSRSFRDPSRN